LLFLFFFKSSDLTTFSAGFNINKTLFPLPIVFLIHFFIPLYHKNKTINIMKKIYTLAIALIGAFAFGQNMLENHSFENWTETAPDNWLITLGNNGGSVELETTIVQDGNNAVKLVAPNGTGHNRIGYVDFEIVPGTSYTLTYWFLDEDDNARFRHWGSFRTGTLDSSTALPNNEQSPEFQPASYFENTNGWQQVTVTGTAPSNGNIMRLDFRAFQQEAGAGGGTIYVDNVDFR